MQELIKKIEAYGFRCVAGPLTCCRDWQDLKAKLVIQPEPEDSVYAEAVVYVRECGVTNVARLQRQFRIGYNRAARLLEAMEKAGVIAEPDENLQCVANGIYCAEAVRGAALGEK